MSWGNNWKARLMRFCFGSDPNTSLGAAADQHVGKTDLLRVVRASFGGRIGVKRAPG